MSSQVSARERRLLLRQLIGNPEILVTPSAYDCLSARLLENAGFPAVSVSGAAVSASRLGLPDLGFAGLQDMVETVYNVSRTVQVPVLADADTGFGNVLNAIRTAEQLASAGAAALHIEDQVMPKRCGHLAGKAVVPVDEFVAKLRAVCAERPDPAFVIVARTDALAVEGLDATLARCYRYLEAGADAIFVEAPTSMHEVERIAREVPGPKIYNLATGGVSPQLSFNELEQLGFAWVVVPGLVMGAVVEAVSKLASRVLDDRNDRQIASTGFSPSNFFDLFGLSEWAALDAAYASSSESETVG